MAPHGKRGIDLMKEVSDKRAADLRQIETDKHRNFKRDDKRPAV